MSPSLVAVTYISSTAVGQSAYMVLTGTIAQIAAEDDNKGELEHVIARTSPLSFLYEDA